MLPRRLALHGVLIFLLLAAFVIQWRWLSRSQENHSPKLATYPVKASNKRGPGTTNNFSAMDDGSASLPLEEGTLPKVRLTRLGSELAFNSDLCPSDSLVRKGVLNNPSGMETHTCPKLFIIGAKKGGTTSLYNYTAQHPDFEGIRLTNVSKWFGETLFFAQKWGKEPLSDYLAQFPSDRMSGDASVDNLVHCEVPRRIFTTCGPDTKVIVLLRDPLERYISNFMMRISRNGYLHYNPSTPISYTTKNEQHILARRLKRVGLSLPELNLQTDWSKLICLFACCDSMIYEGLYYIFIMNWLCNFPSQNIMIVNSEEMFLYPASVLKQVFSFLGLKPLEDETLREITSLVYNKTPWSFSPNHQLSTRDRKKLLNIYRPFNKELIDLLGWHNIAWSMQ